MIDVYAHFSALQGGCYYYVYRLTRTNAGNLTWERVYGIYIWDEVMWNHPNSFPLEALRDRDGHDYKEYREGDLLL